MIEIEQYRLMLPNFTLDTLYEERAFALGEEWQDRYEAIQQELHRRGLIGNDQLARDPFDPATIAEEDKADIAKMDNVELVRFFNSVKPTYETTETWEPFDQMVADEVKRRGLSVDV